MYIHAYILYLSLLSKLWPPTCLKRTNSISALRNLTVDHTNRVCRDDVICCLAQPQQDGLVKLSAYQSCDGFPCLGASTMAAVLHRLEGVVFTCAAQREVGVPHAALTDRRKEQGQWRYKSSSILCV